MVLDVDVVLVCALDLPLLAAHWTGSLESWTTGSLAGHVTVSSLWT